MVHLSLAERLEKHARDWGVVAKDSFETETSVIAFGMRGRQPVVLKVVKLPGDEWHSGAVLEAFAGNGFAEVYAHAPGALLLERLQPGTSLVEVSLSGRDAEATEIFAEVIGRMSIVETKPSHSPTVEDWGQGFKRYLDTGYAQIQSELVEAAQKVFFDLCASQGQRRLLHGDLQHYNVLYDAKRGWLAIDPKGVFGELEYEVGAVLRNPTEQPELYISRSTIKRRIKQFSSKLNLDDERVLGWGFAQAVLSAIWDVEDGAMDMLNPILLLAEKLRSILRV